MNDDFNPRQMPHDLQAEEAVLGSMLAGGTDAIIEAQGILVEVAFYSQPHRVIWSAILSMSASGVPVDLVTLSSALEGIGMLEQVGGREALTRMFTLIPSSAALAFYAETVQEKYLLRQMIEGANKVIQDCYEPTASEEIPEKIDHAAKFFTSLALSLDPKRAGLAAPSEAVPETMEEIEAIYAGRGGTFGLDTGIYGLDRMTNGFLPEQVITLAARTSNGKTSLAMNIAEHVALAGNPVAVFSLEMSAGQLWKRLLFSKARVEGGKLRSGMMSRSEMDRIHQAAAVFNPRDGAKGAAPIYVDSPTSLLKIFQLAAKARAAVLTKGVKFIIIDYLQLMVSGTKRGADNRVTEIAEITGSIKMLARELKVPIMMLAQVNRKADDRPRGVPRLSDLRESGSIEQDSDIVLFIHRPENYETNEEQLEAITGTANLIVAKNRDGPTTNAEGIPLVFQKSFVRFENHADEKFYSNNPAHRQKNVNA